MIGDLWNHEATKIIKGHKDELSTLMPHEPISGYVEGIARQVVDAAFHVHSALGPGLLESVYEECLSYELSLRGAHSERQKALPVTYKD